MKGNTRARQRTKVNTSTSQCLCRISARRHIRGARAPLPWLRVSYFLPCDIPIDNLEIFELDDSISRSILLRTSAKQGPSLHLTYQDSLTHPFSMSTPGEIAARAAWAKAPRPTGFPTPAATPQPAPQPIPVTSSTIRKPVPQPSRPQFIPRKPVPTRPSASCGPTAQTETPPRPKTSSGPVAPGNRTPPRPSTANPYPTPDSAPHTFGSGVSEESPSHFSKVHQTIPLDQLNAQQRRDIALYGFTAETDYSALSPSTATAEPMKPLKRSFTKKLKKMATKEVKWWQDSW